jgi:hypothetical protein
MIGHDVARVLPELRAQAESLMVDACIVTAGGGAPTWDDANGQWDAPASSTVYEGKCRVQTTLTAEGKPDAGEREWTVQSLAVAVPMSVVGVGIGDIVTVTASEFDPDLVGRVFTVAALAHKTHMTARRLRCEEVTD